LGLRHFGIHFDIGPVSVDRSKYLQLGCRDMAFPIDFFGGKTGSGTHLQIR
jgi:hypothetical protein